MKQLFSLFLGLSLIASLLLAAPTKVHAEESIATTKGSVVLSGWGDQEQPEPNIPSGPQGESTLVNQSAQYRAGQQGNGAVKNFPKTNDSVNKQLSVLGLLLLLICLLLLKIRQQNRVGEKM